MKNNKEIKSFWITNISTLNVSLADLNLTIKSFSSVNLLDKRHYQYTEEQIKKSVEEGSLFKKRDKLVVRKVAPDVVKPKDVQITKSAFIPSRERSVYQIKEENNVELNFSNEEQKISDEKFANDNAETADLDQKPLFVKRS